MAGHKRLRRIFAVIAGIAVLATAISVSAVWDESKAVHITASEIENSSLIIGSHLIHLSVLTSTLYDVAQTSAEESGQTRIYYKSELADGTWFDITEAMTLEDITTSGTPVEDAVIEALFLTHHTKSDGITYDLATGKPVSPVNIRDPYDLESMEELFPLVNQLKLMEETQNDSAVGQEKIARLTKFFTETVTKSETTAKYDNQIAKLQAYHDNVVAPRGDPKEMETLQGVIESLDSARRAEVMAVVEAALDEYVIELPKIEDTEGDDEEEGKAGTAPDTALQSAANDSLENVKNSLINYQGKMLAIGITVISQHRYTVINQLISDCEAGNTSACDADLYDLISLDNILGSVVADQQNELALLENHLLDKASQLYLAGLAAGENAEYKSATTDSLKRGIARDYASTVNTWRGEYEFLIEAKCMRIAKDAGLTYIDGLLTAAKGGHHALVPQDGFAYNVSTCVDEHIAFLERKRRELELGLGGNELDKLLVEKDLLQQQQLAALDQNNLAAAQELQAQIDGLNEQIKQLGADPDSASEGTVGGLVADLTNQALEAVRNGNASGAAEILNSLSELMDGNAALALPAVSQIRSAMVARRDLDGDTSFDDAIAAAEQAILDNKELFDAATRAEKTAADLEAIAEAFTADLDEHDQIPVYLLALDLYWHETGSNAALDLMKTVATRQRGLGDPLVFTRVNDGGTEYLPATAVASYKNMRYVWNRNKNEATLAIGGSYYLFTIYSKDVYVSSASQTEQMSAPAKLQGEAHIPESYTYPAFGVEALYISNTGYGVLISDDIRDLADELLGEFLG